MKTKNLNQETLTDAGAMIGGAFLGGGVSRVVEEVLTKPSKDSKDGKGMLTPKIAHAVLATAGVVGSAYIDDKDTTGKLGQGVCLGVASVQLTKLIKDMVNPEKEGMLKTALGTPEPEKELVPVYIERDNYESYTPTFSYTDYDESSRLSGNFEDEVPTISLGRGGQIAL